MIILNPSIDCDFLVFLIYVLGVRLLGYLGSGWFVVTYLHTFFMFVIYRFRTYRAVWKPPWIQYQL